MKITTWKPKKNWIGSSKFQKKFTFLLFLLCDMLNFYAWVHDNDYVKLYKKGLTLEKARELKLKFDRKILENTWTYGNSIDKIVIYPIYWTLRISSNWYIKNYLNLSQ